MSISSCYILTHLWILIRSRLEAAREDILRHPVQLHEICVQTKNASDKEEVAGRCQLPQLARAVTEKLSFISLDLRLGIGSRGERFIFKTPEAYLNVMTLAGLHTATIGSFPLDDSEGNRARILDDLVGLKIDFPNYPQLMEMGEQFLSDIRSGTSPPGLEPFNWAVAYLERKNLRDEVKLKACMTGPFTLASYVKREGALSSGMPLSDTALASRDEVERLTEVLAESCRALGGGASMVFIDEPILSLMVGRARILLEYEGDDIVHAYNRLRDACGDMPVGSHICGRISPLMAEILLETDLDLLSHEFFDTPENFARYDRKGLEESGKTLAVGCVSTTRTRVEDVGEIRSFMEKAMERYGENLIFTPDCGFKNLGVDGSREVSYQIAIKKLRNMVTALSTLK